MSRHDLTDAEWDAIGKYLPVEYSGEAGRPWKDHRQVINGILLILTAGAAWRDLPTEYGNWNTVYGRFRRWTQSHLWDQILSRLLSRMELRGKIDRLFWCVDGSIVRAHRCAAGAIKTRPDEQEKQALGRSQGGFSTKIRLMTDGHGNPVAFHASAGQNHEAKELPNLMSKIQLSSTTRPSFLAGDKGYSSNSIRDWLNATMIRPVIPTRKNEATKPFAPRLYKQRNIIERVIGRLKECRRIATRYDKLSDSYIAFLKIASIRKLLRHI